MQNTKNKQGEKQYFENTIVNFSFRLEPILNPSDHLYPKMEFWQWKLPCLNLLWLKRKSSQKLLSFADVLCLL